MDEDESEIEIKTEYGREVHITTMNTSVIIVSSFKEDSLDKLIKKAEKLVDKYSEL